jgi:hypothetical protein
MEYTGEEEHGYLLGHTCQRALTKASDAAQTTPTQQSIILCPMRFADCLPSGASLDLYPCCAMAVDNKHKRRPLVVVVVVDVLI